MPFHLVDVSGAQQVEGGQDIGKELTDDHLRSVLVVSIDVDFGYQLPSEKFAQHPSMLDRIADTAAFAGSIDRLFV